MELDKIRNEINKYDEAIKGLLTLRMSLIPIVADIKIKNDLPIVQGKREKEIYRKIEILANENGISEELLKNIYKLIISEAVRIEENILEEKMDSILSTNTENSNELNQKFKDLDNALENISKIISEIKEISENNNLNLTEKSTLYYNDKTK